MLDSRLKAEILPIMQLEHSWVRDSGFKPQAPNEVIKLCSLQPQLLYSSFHICSSSQDLDFDVLTKMSVLVIAFKMHCGSGSSRGLTVFQRLQPGCWGGGGATWRSAAAVSPSAAHPAETSPSPFSPRPDVVCSPAGDYYYGSVSMASLQGRGVNIVSLLLILHIIIPPNISKDTVHLFTSPFPLL